MIAHVYEVRIDLWTDTARYYSDHRFPGMPSQAVLEELTGESRRIFKALHDEDPEKVEVRLVYLEAAERERHRQDLGVGQETADRT